MCLVDHSFTRLFNLFSHVVQIVAYVSLRSQFYKVVQSSQSCSPQLHMCLLDQFYKVVQSSQSCSPQLHMCLLDHSFTRLFNLLSHVVHSCICVSQITVLQGCSIFSVMQSIVAYVSLRSQLYKVVQSSQSCSPQLHMCLLDHSFTRLFNLFSHVAQIVAYVSLRSQFYKVVQSFQSCSPDSCICVSQITVLQGFSIFSVMQSIVAYVYLRSQFYKVVQSSQSCSPQLHMCLLDHSFTRLFNLLSHVVHSCICVSQITVLQGCSIFSVMQSIVAYVSLRSQFYKVVQSSQSCSPQLHMCLLDHSFTRLFNLLSHVVHSCICVSQITVLQGCSIFSVMQSIVTYGSLRSQFYKVVQSSQSCSPQLHMCLLDQFYKVVQSSQSCSPQLHMCLLDHSFTRLFNLLSHVVHSYICVSQITVLQGCSIFSVMQSIVAYVSLRSQFYKVVQSSQSCSPQLHMCLLDHSFTRLFNLFSHVVHSCICVSQITVLQGCSIFSVMQSIVAYVYLRSQFYKVVQSSQSCSPQLHMCILDHSFTRLFNLLSHVVHSYICVSQITVLQGCSIFSVMQSIVAYVSLRSVLQGCSIFSVMQSIVTYVSLRSQFYKVVQSSQSCSPQLHMCLLDHSFTRLFNLLSHVVHSCICVSQITVLQGCSIFSVMQSIVTYGSLRSQFYKVVQSSQSCSPQLHMCLLDQFYKVVQSSQSCSPQLHMCILDHSFTRLFNLLSHVVHSCICVSQISFTRLFNLLSHVVHSYICVSQITVLQSLRCRGNVIKTGVADS